MTNGLIFENFTPRNPNLRGRTALFDKCFYSEAPLQTDEPVGPEAVEGLVVRLLGAVSGAILDKSKKSFYIQHPYLPRQTFC